MDHYFTVSKLLTPLVLPSNFLIICLIVFFYFGIVKKKKLFKKVFIILFITFSTISIFPIGKLLFYHFLEKDFYEQNVPKNIDFIFVPSGGVERFISAINIKNKHDLKDIKIIYSGGNPFLDKKNSVDQEKSIINTTIKNSKIEYSDIIFLPEARNTFENIKRLNEYLNKTNSQNSQILLITHAFHLKRCLLISRKYNLNVSGFASSYYTKNFSTGLVNSYQTACTLCNLRYVDIFVKEILSLIFAKISLINEH
jgi:uncharacterized SAM-binding protein YcdF (DUF218 family)